MNLADKHNAAAMREALKEIDRVVFDKRRHTKEEVEAHRLATEALTVPPRNCDVGTPQEQEARWNDYCDDVTRGDCPPSGGCKSCALYWAQLPYKSAKRNEG